MWVAFTNNSGGSVSVAIMKRDTDACGGEGGGWATAGWWNLNPGESKTAFWTTNRYAYYYAHGPGGIEWSDPNGPTPTVEDTKFSSCLDIGTSSGRDVGMKKIDVGWPPVSPGTHTINLNR